MPTLTSFIDHQTKKTLLTNNSKKYELLDDLKCIFGRVQKLKEISKKKEEIYKLFINENKENISDLNELETQLSTFMEILQQKDKLEAD